MKKRINLLYKSRQAVVSEQIKQRIRIGSTIVGVFLFLVFIISTVLQLLLFNEKNDLLKQKLELNTYIKENETFAVKFAYFNSKTTQMKKYLGEDAQFLPYY